MNGVWQLAQSLATEDKNEKPYEMHLKTVSDVRKRETYIYWLPPPTDQSLFHRC